MPYASACRAEGRFPILYQSIVFHSRRKEPKP